MYSCYVVCNRRDGKETRGFGRYKALVDEIVCYTVTMKLLAVKYVNMYRANGC
jgi:hypothetical protein